MDSISFKSVPMSLAQSVSTASGLRGFLNEIIPSGRSILTNISPFDDMFDKNMEDFERELGKKVPKEIVELRYNHYQIKRRSK